jgi:hypothetical protein
MLEMLWSEELRWIGGNALLETRGMAPPHLTLSTLEADFDRRWLGGGLSDWLAAKHAREIHGLWHGGIRFL